MNVAVYQLALPDQAVAVNVGQRRRARAAAGEMCCYFGKNVAVFQLFLCFLSPESGELINTGNTCILNVGNLDVLCSF